MSEVSILKINSRNLPVFLELNGDNGEKELYEIKPARKKFGAMLNKVNDSMRKLLFNNK